MGCCIGQATLAAPSSIAVLYPAIQEPYRGIFHNIMSGIESRLGKSIRSYALRSDYSIQEVEDWLKKSQVEMIITLGNRGLLAARELQPKFKVVVGAVLIAPDGNSLTGISLTPDPKYFFQKLKELIPGVKRVTVIYNQKHSSWIIKQAKEIAENYALTLNAYPVKHLREAAVLYRKTLGQLESGIDAIWLPHDQTVDEETILPLILRESWERNLVVFSSNLSYVKRGILFALYPDNKNMGRSLAELALKQMHNHENTPLGIMPLHDLFIAVNIRTAEHLGLGFTAQMKREFNLVFPLQ